jgi:hypothetical protein
LEPSIKSSVGQRQKWNSLPRWQHEKAWTDKLKPQIDQIIEAWGGTLIQVLSATVEDDQQHAIDYYLKLNIRTEVAFRARRNVGLALRRDLTLRHSVPSGAPTETDKIIAGCVDWYLYTWVEQRTIVDWMIAEMAVVRRCELIEAAIRKGQVQATSEGGSFVYLLLTDLAAVGAIHAESFIASEPRIAS